MKRIPSGACVETFVGGSLPSDPKPCRSLHRRGAWSTWRRNIFGAASGGLLLIGIGDPIIGLAQSAPAAQETQQSNQLAEITVTALKTQTSTLDVPIAVSELPEASLQEYNIQTAADFEMTIPNLAFEVGPTGTTTAVIRGVSGSNVTAFYIDDTPAPEGLDPRLFDLASIEVLKGPQGTLYGQGSMGGNIKYVTEKPSLTGEDTGSLLVQGGETGMGDSPDYGFQGSGNFVWIPDRVAIRISGVYQHDAGYTKDADPAIPDDPAYVGFVPAQGWGPPGFMVNELGPNLPRVYADRGDTDSLGGTLSIRVAITDALESTTGVIAQSKTLPNGPNNALAPPTNGYVPTSYVEAQPVYTPQYDQTLLWMWYEDLTYKGDGFTLTSSTSYTYSWTNVTDQGTLPQYEYIHAYYGWNPNTSDLPPVPWTSLNGNEEYTEEARLSFDRVPFIKGLSGVLGVFGTFSHTNGCLGGISGGGGNDSDCIPEVDVGIQAQGLWPTDMEWWTADNGESYQKSIFGELYYQPIKPLTVTLGLRYYWQYNDDQEEEGPGIDDTPISQCVPNGGHIVPPITAAGGYCLKLSQPFAGSGLIPKYAVAYKPTENQEIYATRSQGFRPGGPAAPPFAFCATILAAHGETLPAAFLQPLKSDKLVNWELGYKATFLDQQFVVTTDVFDIEWTNKQQSVEIPLCEIGENVNLGAARIQGGEFELDGKPIPDFPLDVRFSVGVAHTFVTSSGPAGTVGAAPIGSELLDTPEWTGSLSANYTFHVLMHDAFAESDYNYTGEKASTYWTAENPSTLPGYRILNARLGVKVGAAEKTEVSLYGRNLTNAKPSVGLYTNGGYYTSEVIKGQEVTDPTVIVEPPVTVGVQVRTRF